METQPSALGSIDGFLAQLEECAVERLEETLERYSVRREEVDGVVDLVAERWHETYEQIFARVMREVAAEERRLVRERLRAGGLWARLERQPQARRLLLVHNDARFHNRGLFDRLLDRARETRWVDARSGAELAELALAVADRLDPGEHAAVRAADLRASALGVLGDCRRLHAEVAAAGRALAQAREMLARGSGDPLEDAHLVTMEAALLADLGRFERAARHLERAIEVCRELDDRHLWGRALILQGEALGRVDPMRGIDLSREGLALLEPGCELRLELCGRHNLIWFLNDSGQPGDALRMLEVSRPLYRQLPEPWVDDRLHWLEARISRRLGDLEAAESTLLWLREELARRGLRVDQVLVSIDLIEVLAAGGRHQGAAALAGSLLPELESWGLHAEGLTIWRSFHRSLGAGRAHGAFFAGLAAYFRRSWHQPAAQRLSV